MTGTLEGALWGAFSGMAFFAIGTEFAGTAGNNGVLGSSYTGPELVRASVAHGVAGGTISKLQGGRFGHGFLSAGLSKLSSPAIHTSGANRFSQVAMATVVGGSVSSITGGKFANGAVTAAMAYAFNQLQSDGVGRFEDGNSPFRKLVDEMREMGQALKEGASTFFRESGEFGLETVEQVSAGIANTGTFGIMSSEWLAENGFDTTSFRYRMGQGVGLYASGSAATRTGQFVLRHPGESARAAAMALDISVEAQAITLYGTRGGAILSRMSEASHVIRPMPSRVHIPINRTPNRALVDP